MLLKIVAWMYCLSTGNFTVAKLLRFTDFANLFTKKDWLNVRETEVPNLSEFSLTSLVVSTSGKDGKNFFEMMERERENANKTCKLPFTLCKSIPNFYKLNCTLYDKVI